MKVFLGPTEVSGFCKNLKSGFEQINIDADFINLSYHPFIYEGNNNCVIANLIYKCNKVIYTKSLKRIQTLFLKLLKSVLKIIFFFKALFKYDTYIFIFGQSLLPRNVDLVVYKILKKTTIMNVAMGSEARPPYFNGTYYEEENIPEIALVHLVKSSREIFKKLKFIEKYSSYIIGAPFSSSPFCNREFINYFALGFPQLKMEVSESFGDRKKSIRILHCPSHPFAKGTSKIIESINNLKLKGYDIEFVLIQNVTNNEVLSEISKCDFVVDQIYSDTPLAGFASEAMALGKVPIVGGYSFDYLSKMIPDKMIPPSFTCKPEEVEKAIENLINNKELREFLSFKGRDFILNQWSAENVAKRYLKIIENKVSNDWYINPYDVNYFYGGGQDKNKTKSVINQIVSKFGVSALMLDHNPMFRNKLIEFACLDEGANR